MKKARLDCTILESDHASIKSTSALFGLSIKNYILFCHQTQNNLIELAKNEGILMKDIPKAIEKMFEYQAMEDHLKEFFRLLQKI